MIFVSGKQNIIQLKPQTGRYSNGCASIIVCGNGSTIYYNKSTTHMYVYIYIVVYSDVTGNTHPLYTYLFYIM